MALLKGRHLAGCVGVCLREHVSQWVSVMKCVLWIMNVCCILSKAHTALQNDLQIKNEENLAVVIDG